MIRLASAILTALAVLAAPAAAADNELTAAEKAPVFAPSSARARQKNARPVGSRSVI